jgi:hypothetical protein
VQPLGLASPAERLRVSGVPEHRLHQQQALRPAISLSYPFFPTSFVYVGFSLLLVIVK